MMVVILDYGAGNLFSVRTAVERLGYEVRVSGDPRIVERADKVIFPGVGQASTAMERLKRAGLEGVIPELRVPVLGICLGMQLMCAFSEEGATRGLGIFPLTVRRITGDCKVPHVGWNRVYGLKSGLFAGLGEREWVYFVHSYCVPTNEFEIAACDYPLPFTAAIRRDNFWGCQFHPEKSGEVGRNILCHFLEM